jgi:hypothetical protein
MSNGTPTNNPIYSAIVRFAQACDIESADSAVVNIIDDLTVAVLASAIHTSTPDPNINVATWEDVGPIALPAAALDRSIRIEFRFTGGGGAAMNYLGWHIDDVELSAP